MAKEDLLIKQIAQLGFVLRKMFEKLIGSESGTELEENVKQVSLKLNDELCFDLESVVALPDEEIVSFLLQNQNFNIENLELFADLLLAVDEVIFQKKALLIYSHIDINTATFSIERNSKIEKIKANQS
jgi:hypothetical protein